jgi:hypothetical protein
MADRVRSQRHPSDGRFDGVRLPRWTASCKGRAVAIELPPVQESERKRKQNAQPACYSAAAVASCGKTFRLGEVPSPAFWGRPANRRRASAIFTRPSTPVSTTSTIVKDEWK